MLTVKRCRQYIGETDVLMERRCRSAAQVLLLGLSLSLGFIAGSVDNGKTAYAAGTLPETYDCRMVGKSPVVKNQGSLGTCWALSACSALEAALLPETEAVFSADHMSLNNGFVISQQEGGDYKMIMAYLSGWYGPVLETEDPYGDGETTDGLSASAHVQEMILLRGKTAEEIKNMILTYGPVQTSLVMNLSLTDPEQGIYREDTSAYYDTVSATPDHEVLLLGWDDTYSAENFAQIPEGNGAWICQNTWGEDFGDGGIFYVSYYDANIAQRGLAYTKVDGTDNYDCIYQSDVCGWQGQQGYGKAYCYFANVFTAETDELLKAVGFYSTRTQTDYEIYIVHDFEDASSFDNKEYLQLGSLHDLGYFTIDLEKEVQLSAGERFAVVVNINSPGSTRPVAVELKKDAYTALVTTDGKEGYLSLYGGAWDNTEDMYGTNVCLKAYTDAQ